MISCLLSDSHKASSQIAAYFFSVGDNSAPPSGCAGQATFMDDICPNGIVVFLAYEWKRRHLYYSLVGAQQLEHFYRWLATVFICQVSECLSDST